MAILREISTKAEPDLVRIDGVDYPLADPGALSALESAQLRRRGKVLTTQAQDDLTDEQATAIDSALAEIFALVAPSIPAEVAAKLTPAHKAAVIEAFTMRRSVAPTEPARKPAPAPRTPTTVAASRSVTTS